MGRLSWIILVGPIWSQGYLKVEGLAEESEGDMATEEWSERYNVAGF